MLGVSDDAAFRENLALNEPEIANHNFTQPLESRHDRINGSLV
jgi:hypothetical protein